MRTLSFALVLVTLFALSACASNNGSSNVDVKPKGEMVVGGSVSGTR